MKSKVIKLRPFEVTGTRASLVSFVYELLRDHVPAATVEHVTRNSLTIKTIQPFVSVKMSNGYLARYAAEVVARLLGDAPKKRGKKSK